ncbi:helicase HerA domain-containing protein [Marinobacterium stanieri]|uniref:helicase HerA domain-containing protein n=1 Tax=Marinobacterium stanieri TaxID=49186 RepID=UPI003A8FD9B3
MDQQLQTVLKQDLVWLNNFTAPAEIDFAHPTKIQPRIRLIRLDEINEDKHQVYRQALVNVYASLDPDEQVRMLYLLEGSANGVNLYFGVVSDTADLVFEAYKNLRGALEGQLPGINFGNDVEKATTDELIHAMQGAKYQGVILGTPTGQGEDNSQDENNYQDIDRLVRALQFTSRRDAQSNSRWQLAVLSQPLTRQSIDQQLEAAYQLSSKVSALIRTSVQTGGNTSRQKSSSIGKSESFGTNESTGINWGENEGASKSTSQGSSSGSTSSSSSGTNKGTNTGTSQSKNVGTSKGGNKNSGTSTNRSTTNNDSLSDSTGSSVSVSQELANKQAQHLADYLDKQLIPRLQKGLTKGLFNTSVYFSASDRSTYKRMKNTLRATLQGSEATMSPLVPYDLPEEAKGQMLSFPQAQGNYSSDELIFRSLSIDSNDRFSSLLTGDELAIVASLPQQELQGVRRRKTVDFVVDLPDINPEASLDLGMVIDRGRRYKNNRVCLSRQDLNKHVFVTGVTGSGKTTTCLNLLLESNMPFLVIEPAKTEYRELAETLGDEVEYYRPNGDDYQSLRINPFALVRKQQRIKSHAGFLKNVFAAVFPMEASMPMMVEAAILAAYEDKGWDIDENEFLLAEDPFDPKASAWPTMGDMVTQLDKLIPTYKLGKEFEEKYRGSLVSRLRSLMDGTLGRVLDVPQSIDFDGLLERRVVIELEELQDSNEKALMMALLLGAINETMRDKHAIDPSFRQLTLVEEAHRLLSRPEPGDKTAALAVESFADMLAEVRKYGTGMIIADQIPAKLIPDVIKNTHTKIVHRLFAEDDRRAMGEAMMMDDKQRGFLPNLGTGEAVVFCGGWHGPVHAGIRNDRAQTDNPAQLNLHKHYVLQLWEQRKRYYPQFCELGWFTEDKQDAEEFADFVRTARQAQNQLLHAIDKERKTAARRQGAYNRLRTWLMEQLSSAQQYQPLYSSWRQHQAYTWPEGVLEGAWIALLLDANPKLHASVVQAMPLTSATDREIMALATTDLFIQLREHETVVDGLDSVNKGANPDLRAHLDHMKNFKSI